MLQPFSKEILRARHVTRASLAPRSLLPGPITVATAYLDMSGIPASN